MAVASGIATQLACVAPFGAPRGASPQLTSVEVEIPASSSAEPTLTGAARLSDLDQAAKALERGDLAAASASLGAVHAADPDQLEGWVMVARVARQRKDAEAEAQAWSRVDQIVTVKGKMTLFSAAANLYDAAEHYLGRDQLGPATLFLEELWRRFPGSRASGLGFVRRAEAALRLLKWSDAERFCAVVRRTHGERNDLSGRCDELMAEARRLRELGPAPSPEGRQWQWEAPGVQGNDLHDVWLGERGEAWVVGDRGVVLRRPAGAGQFGLVESPTRWALYGIAGGGAGNNLSLYAVGAGGSVLGFAQEKWRTVRAPSLAQSDLHDVCLSAGSAERVALVWAVGERGTVLRFDPASGELNVSSAGQQALRGIACSERGVVAVGEEGTMLRLDGELTDRGNARTVPSDTYERLHAVSVAGERILAVGDRRTFVDSDGAKASERVMGWGDLRDLWGSPSQGFWIVGSAGQIYRARTLADAEWRNERSPTVLDLSAIAGDARGRLIAVGAGGTILERSAGGASWRPLAGGVADRLVHVHVGPRPGEALALSRQGNLWRRRRGRWSRQRSLPDGRYWGAWSANDRLVAVGDGCLAVASSGQKAERIGLRCEEGLRGVVGTADGFIAVGRRGTLVEQANGEVRIERVGDGHTLRAAAVGNDGEVWVVGDRGAVLRRRRGLWKPVPTPVLSALRAVWVGPGGPIVAGDDGVIMRWTGSAWREERVPTGDHVVGVWGEAEATLIAATASGSILRREGSSWLVDRSPASCLGAIHGSSQTREVLAVGCHGTVVSHVQALDPLGTVKGTARLER